jgi:hypothetical protein
MDRLEASPASLLNTARAAMMRSLTADIENRYWQAKKNLPMEKRAGFLRDLRTTSDDIVKQVFENSPRTIADLLVENNGCDTGA